MWHTGSGKETTLDSIMKEISSHLEKSGSIFIGCDSQINRDRCTFSTVVCLHGSDYQSGGYYYFRRKNKKKDKFPTMINRLLKEVEL